MKIDSKKSRRFSSEFRKEQAKLIEQGKYTIPEMCRLYDVAYDTVKNWVKKYGKGPYPCTKYVTCKNDVDRLRELEKEIRNLKQIVGEQQIEIIYKDKVIQKAKEQLGNDFEKKF